MGKRLTASEETALLRTTVREAHEATQALRDAIREARALTSRLVDDLQATHTREMTQLANHLQNEMNHASANLNASVAAARDEIVKQLTVASLEVDRNLSSVRFVFDGGTFDDQVSPPYPGKPVKGTTS